MNLAEAQRAEDPSDPYLKLDYANALYGIADLLLNVSDNSLKDWPRALELAQRAVSYTERRDPQSLALLAQALRFAKRPAEALETAKEAAKLLPPPEKRTPEEKSIAKEIDYELNKGRSSAAPSAPPVGKLRRD